MNYLGNARALNRPLAEASDLYSKPTQVQILDITRAADGTIGTARVLVGEGIQSSLPELSNGTVIRWIHTRTVDMDFDLLLNFALTHQEFSKEDRVCMYQLLRQFRENQQRSSNHGKYFEPACLQQTQLFEESETRVPPQFISLPYIAIGDSSSISNTFLPLRDYMYPTRSLLQYHYRREPSVLIVKRDSEQTSRKLAGPDSSKLVIVKNLWILVLNESTMLTVAPTDGEHLWSDLGLISRPYPLQSEHRTSNLWGTLDLLADRLQQRISSAIDELEYLLSYQRWFRKSLPASFANRVGGDSSDSGGSPTGFGGFMFYLINPEWILRLQHRFSTLEGFLTSNRARFEGLRHMERSAVSAEIELQSESLYMSLYEGVGIYLDIFSKVCKKSTIALLFPSNRELLCKVWLDVKHQSQLFLWKVSAMDLNIQVMTATGLSETERRHDIPTEIEQLMFLLVESLTPGDSTESACSRISDIYSQYIARLQLWIEQEPSKHHTRNIYQTLDELEIINGIVESQRKVVEQMVKIFREQQVSDPQNICTGAQKMSTRPETPTKTLQKMQQFQSGLREYQTSCSRLAMLAAQRQTDARIENIGKVILVLTITTTIFLPLVFVSNLFGMNFVDIREMRLGQWVFWVSALGVTLIAGIFALVIAFFGEVLMLKVRDVGGFNDSRKVGLKDTLKGK
ncbi:hypothetical protein DFP73DRAFT_559717 [Morchella snyderi]|nr:hypothetical protein DFP73DRAFT_559717 [Morchella snyderi]